MSAQTMTVTVTGAGGQIGYALLFRLASGEIFPGYRIRLRLLEIPQGMKAAVGVALELQDCAFAALDDVEVTDNPVTAFEGANIALLVGARPRGPGMERADLLEANAQIFGPQGAAIAASAAADVKVAVVGNPANTNALIAAASANGVPKTQFTALTRLDENRARAILADAVSARVEDVSQVVIWGNHSATQFPDVTFARVGGISAVAAIEQHEGDATAWLDDSFVPRVAKRGAEIIEVKGSSSVASAANAALDHVRDWVLGTGERWTSAAVVSRGEYGVPDGLVCSFPVRAANGSFEVITGLDLDDRQRRYLDASVAELVSERDAVAELGLLPT